MDQGKLTEIPEVRVGASIHHRIEQAPPILAWILHHHSEEHRHLHRFNGRPIADLVAVHAAVPGRTGLPEHRVAGFMASKEKAPFRSGFTCVLAADLELKTF